MNLAVLARGLTRLCVPRRLQRILQFGAGVSRVLECPKGMVGRVIGKAGETIKALQKQFQCNIQIDQVTRSSPPALTLLLVATPNSATAVAARSLAEIAAENTCLSRVLMCRCLENGNETWNLVLELMSTNV